MTALNLALKQTAQDEMSELANRLNLTNTLFHTYVISCGFRSTFPISISLVLAVHHIT